MKRPRIIVAGQVPPPMGGQNAMILELLEDLQALPDISTGHLAFEFTKDTSAARKGHLGKFFELIRVILRLVKLRIVGPIDLMVFPPGGPQNVPLLRDLFLLPWILLFSRKVVLHFHAAGIADALETGGLLARSVAWLYGRCDDALVMTDYNRRDPLSCGIQNVHIFPHQLIDRFEPEKINRSEGGETRILAMGHLCRDKGTQRLIEAVGSMKKEFPGIILELAGEPLAPYTREDLQSDITKADLGDRVRVLGVVSGVEKSDVFGRAHVFVFPSTAPYESFGLVMVEALMWALPVVASDWRGNADVLAESPGTSLFSPADSPAALAGALGKMLRNQEQWAEIGAANRQSFESRFAACPPKPKPMLRKLLEIASNRPGDNHESPI